jgi:hypothetical protein
MEPVNCFCSVTEPKQITAKADKSEHEYAASKYEYKRFENERMML